jgi:hypothetical protein
MAALGETDKAWHAKWLEGCKDFGERKYRWPWASREQRDKRQTAYAGWPHPLDSKYFGAPEAVVERLPTLGQRAVELTQGIHALLHEWGVDTHDAEGGIPLTAAQRRRLLVELAQLSTLGNTREGTRRMELYESESVGYAAYKTGALDFLVDLIRWDIKNFGDVVGEASHCIAYICCEDTVQCAAINLGAMDVLTTVVMDVDNLGLSSLVRAKVTDAFSSLMNRREGMRIAMDRDALPRLVQIVDRFVPHMQSVVNAARERGQVPEIDPHRSLYTTVEAIGGLAYEREHRETCVQAVPTLARLLRACHPVAEAHGGRFSQPGPEEAEASAWVEHVDRLAGSRADVNKDMNNVALQYVAREDILHMCGTGPASVPAGASTSEAPPARTTYDYAHRAAADFNLPVPPAAQLPKEHPVLAPPQMHRIIEIVYESLSRIAWEVDSGRAEVIKANILEISVDILKRCAAPIFAASIARTGFTTAYGVNPDGPLHDLGSIRMEGVSFVNIPTSGERHHGNYKNPPNASTERITVSIDVCRTLSSICRRTDDDDSLEDVDNMQMDMVNGVLEMKRALIKLGIVPHLVSLLRCGPWSPIAEAASEALSTIVDELPNGQMESTHEPNAKPPAGRAAVKCGALPVLVEIMRTGDPKSDVVGNCAHSLASITRCNPGARLQCIALNVFPLAVQLLYSKPPSKNVMPPRPEVEAYEGNMDTKPIIAEVTTANGADEKAARRNVNVASPGLREGGVLFKTASGKDVVVSDEAIRRSRSILGEGFGGWADAPATLDKKVSLGLDDHVDTAYRNALSLEQPAPPKDDKGHSPFNRWASTIYSVCDLLINLVEYTEYGVPAAFEAGLLHAIVALLGDCHRDQALVAQTILKHMYTHDSHAVVTALWTNPRAMVGLLHYAKDDPESEVMAHDVLKSVFYFHSPKIAAGTFNMYRCDLMTVYSETFARCLPDLLGVSTNNTNKLVRDLRYTAGRFAYMLKQAKRLQHLSTTNTEHLRVKPTDVIKFNHTLSNLTASLREWMEHMSSLVEEIFLHPDSYTGFQVLFDEDTRKKIVKRAVAAISANKFDNVDIAKYALSLDGVTNQALRYATWKRDASGNMEFGFVFRRVLKDPYHAEDGDVFMFDRALDGLPNLLSYLREPSRDMRHNHNAAWCGIALALLASENGCDLVHRYKPTVAIHANRAVPPDIEDPHNTFWKRYEGLGVRWPSVASVIGFERAADDADSDFEESGQEWIKKQYIAASKMHVLGLLNAASSIHTIVRKAWNHAHDIAAGHEHPDHKLYLTEDGDYADFEDGPENDDYFTNPLSERFGVHGHTAREGAILPSSGRESARAMHGVFRRLLRCSREERFLQLEGRMRDAWQESEMPSAAMPSEHHGGPKVEALTSSPSSSRKRPSAAHTPVRRSKRRRGEEPTPGDEDAVPIEPESSALTEDDVNVDTRDGRTVALRVGGSPFHVRRRILETNSPLMRDILADADAAAEAGDYSSAARSLQRDIVPLPMASGMPEDPVELRAVFELAMRWLYTGRLPTFFEFRVDDTSTPDPSARERRYLPGLLALAHVLEASTLQNWAAARLAHVVIAEARTIDACVDVHSTPPTLVGFGSPGGVWALRCALEGPVPAEVLLAESPPLRRALAYWASCRLGGCYALPACVLPYRDLLEPAMMDLMCGLPVGGPPIRQPVPAADCATLSWVSGD